MSHELDRGVARMPSDSVKWKCYPEDVLPLWVADMDFPVPDPVIRALHARIDEGIFGYAKEPPELRSTICERLKRLYGWQVPPDALIFLPGVVAGFNLACRAAAAPGDGVLVQTPVYPPILAAHANAGLTCDQMQLSRLSDGRYGVDFSAFEAAITPRTRLFILCSPHNPVGRVFTREELERMARICLEHDITVCSDEIHCDLVFSGVHHIPTATLSPEIAAHTITLMAPSKTFNMAGLRCSFAIIQDAALRRRFEEAAMGVAHQEVSALGYTAALAAYSEGGPWLEEVLVYLESNRDFLLEYVRERLPGITAASPEGTYLAWLDCRQAGIRGDPARFFLEKAKVALNEGPSFGRGGWGFARLNFACTRATLVEALERMRAALEGLHRR